MKYLIAIMYVALIMIVARSVNYHSTKKTNLETAVAVTAISERDALFAQLETMLAKEGNQSGRGQLPPGEREITLFKIRLAIPTNWFAQREDLDLYVLEPKTRDLAPAWRIFVTKSADSLNSAADAGRLDGLKNLVDASLRAGKKVSLRMIQGRVWVATEYDIPERDVNVLALTTEERSTVYHMEASAERGLASEVRPVLERILGSAVFK